MIISPMIDVIGALTTIIETVRTGRNFQMLPPLPKFYCYSLKSCISGALKNSGKLFLYHQLPIYTILAAD